MTGGFVEADFVGLTVEAAIALAEERGWRPRRLSPGATTTMEYREGRLNLVAGDDEAVVRAWLG